jgi:hypothetical protein
MDYTSLKEYLFKTMEENNQHSNDEEDGHIIDDK